MTLDHILHAVAESTGVTEQQMQGPSRKHEIAIARALFFTLAREHTLFTLDTIALHCYRTQSAAHYSIKLIEALKPQSKPLQRWLANAQSKLTP